MTDIISVTNYNSDKNQYYSALSDISYFLILYT